MLLYFHIMANKGEKTALAKIRAMKLASEGEVRKAEYEIYK